jgi:hypothetical protein
MPACRDRHDHGRAEHGKTIAEPERIVAEFVAAELGEQPELHGRAYVIDIGSLAPRTTYFDGLGAGDCFVWSDRAGVRAFFCNGSD